MATKRLPWPDAKTRRLIREVEATPLRERKAFLLKQKVGPSFFYNKRKRYLAAHPEFAKELRAADAALTVKEARENAAPAVTFAGADRETKRQLVEEYDNMPYHRRLTFRGEHQVDTKTLTYYRGRFRKEAAVNGVQHTNAVPAKYTSVIPAEVVPTHSLSLDDGIAALELEREMLNTVINKLKHLRR